MKIYKDKIAYDIFNSSTYAKFYINVINVRKNIIFKSSKYDLDEENYFYLNSGVYRILETKYKQHNSTNLIRRNWGKVKK